MKINITEQEGKLIATLEGKLDTAASVQASGQLAALHQCEGRNIEIDCSRLTYISSSGLRLFLNVRKHAAALGCQVALVGVSGDILDVLQTTGFSNLFEIK